MSIRDIRAGGAFVEIGIKNRLAKGSRQVQADLKKLGRNIGGLGLRATGAAGAILAPMLAATKGFASAGDAVDKMSKRTGVGVQTLSALGFAAEQSGADLDSVERGLFGLSRSFFDLTRGGAEAVEAFDRIGLGVNDLDGLTAEQQLMKVADGLRGITDESIRGAVAQKIFGRAGRQLLPMLNEGSAGMRALMTEAGDLGRVLSEDDAASAAELTDALNRVKSVTGGFAVQLGAALAPALTDVADIIATTTRGVVGFVRENRAAIQGAAAGAAVVGLFGAGLMTLGGAITLAGVALGGITAGVGLLLSPMGLAIGGVAALGVGLVRYTSIGGKAIDWLRDRFGPLIDTVNGAAGAIFEALQMGDAATAWALAMDTLELLWLDLTDEIRNAWADAMGWVLDKGADMAAGMGRLFQSLSALLTGLLSKYEGVYNKIYNSVLDAGGAVTGVQTIGGPVNAFENNFGNAKKVALAQIENVRKFGLNMEQAAEGQKAGRREQREADRVDRQQRLDALRQSVTTQTATVQKAAKAAELDAAGDLAKAQAEIDANAAKFGQDQAALEQEQKRTGPSGTFSAFAAGIIGTGETAEMQVQRDQLDALKKIAANTRQPVGRFA